MESFIRAFSTLRRHPVSWTYRSFAAPSSKANVFPAFVKQYFHEVKRSNPSLKPTEILRKLGQMYRAAPASELAKLPVSLSSHPTPKTADEKAEAKKSLTFAKRHGLPKPLPSTGYKVFLHEQLSGQKGCSLSDMTAKLSEASKAWHNLPESKKDYYNQQASENKLAHLRNLRDWAGDQGIQFSRRPSVLASRLYTKHQREQQQAKVKTGPAKRA